MDHLQTRSTPAGDTFAVPVPGDHRWQVGVDWGRGGSVSSYACECGWETSSHLDIVEHLKQHGATRCTFTPQTHDNLRRAGK